MASGTLGDSNDDLNWRGRCRWTENSKVYTRKTHKKAQKTCNNNDTAPTTTSTAEKPISATPTPPDAEVSPSSPPATIPSSTSTPNGTAGGHAVQESVGVVGAKDADSCQNSPEHSPHQEQGLPHGSPDRNADSSCPAPLLEQRQSEHVPSVSEDSYHTHDRVDDDNGSQTAELQDLEDSRLPDGDEAKNLEKTQTPDLRPQERSEPSPVRENDLSNGRDDSADRQPIGNEEQNDGLVQTPGLRPQERSEPSLFRQNDLPNGRDDSADRQPIGNEEQNDVVMHGSFQVSQGNGPIKVNGVKSPPVSKVQLPVGDEGQDDGEMMPGSPQVSEGNGRGNVNGAVKPLVISSIDDRIRFNLCKATPKNEIKKLKKNLEYELDQVRRLFKQLESKELQLASHNAQVSNSNLNNRSNSISAEGANSGEYILSQPQHARSNVVDRRLLLRVNSEVGAIAHHETRPIGLARVNSDIGAARNLEPRLYNRQLSVSVTDNRSSEYTEKEKRTPKANQYYRNSEFLLGKDRLPSESNKRLKTNNGRKHSGETEHAMGFGFGFDKNRNQVFKNCGGLLQRLMKHKFGWVFNEPVNAKALGLVDYHDIIKHPMDLGTIKTRLSQNLYKSPREFAEDVRLVFHNAMTYNPKGQDVHVMAEQLSQIFEERWAIIESEYNPYWKYQVYQDGGLPTPTSRKGVPYSHFGPASVSVSAPTPTPVSSIPLYASVAPQRTSDRPEPVTPFMAVDPKMHRPHVGRTPVPKKPKAKDPNKRDMTYEEKQRLSTNLQGLPPEKLDAIVQIIKKRNTALSQHDDEIEVDIDSVDAETLWELDRFVTNYKKSLSKNKRKAELALQARTMANQNVVLTNSTPEVAIQIESRTDFKKGTALVDDEQERNNASRSSSSSSSSSDSGSTSSDSDSDSSSGDGSDAGHSPKT